MVPAYHCGIWEARAKTCNRVMPGEKGITSTDAFKDRAKAWATVTVTTKEKLLTCVSAKTNNIEDEEKLIVLALTIPGSPRAVD
ncbi:hypothetical protein HPB50_006999 [Hyalomma asiaticum]|uniref:Uncharacterized protein n=1 Tax=Hyalomma asiaticum TaxID=266040 RepID=A0ACB7S9V7_HYAAI|nr:hypothetical protein HPB50_006999 [Hyalomma asiaticum]